MITHWLVIALEEIPKVQIFESERENMLSEYTPTTSFPGSTGHFDWLRSSVHKVIGVRYWPFDDAIHASAIQELLALSRSLNYAYIDCENRFVSFFFGGLISDVIENISNDQDMGENGIYVNQQGKMVVCFEIDSLLLDSFSGVGSRSKTF
jgi:hypothetical protein